MLWPLQPPLCGPPAQGVGLFLSFSSRGPCRTSAWVAPSPAPWIPQPLWWVHPDTCWDKALWEAPKHAPARNQPKVQAEGVSQAQFPGNKPTVSQSGWPVASPAKPDTPPSLLWCPPPEAPGAALHFTHWHSLAPWVCGLSGRRECHLLCCDRSPCFSLLKWWLLEESNPSVEWPDVSPLVTWVTRPWCARPAYQSRNPYHHHHQQFDWGTWLMQKKKFFLIH